MNLSVLTYNIRGNFWSGEATADLARIIKDHSVDVVCLQEVVRNYNTEPRVKVSMVDALKENLGGEYLDVNFLPIQTSSLSSGNVILFRKSLLVPIGAPFSRSFAPMSPRKNFEEWANKYFPPMRRLIMSQRFKMGERSLIIYNSHLDFFGGDRRRKYQFWHMFKLWGVKREVPGTVEILAGDFNTWMPYKMHTIFYRFGLLRKWFLQKGIREASEKIEWTQMVETIEAESFESQGKINLGIIEKPLSLLNKTFRQKEDYIWYGGKGVKLVECERIDVNWSDHYPIYAKFKIEESEYAYR